MKKIALITSLAFVGLSFTAFVAPKTSNDNSFEGVITYSLSSTDSQVQSQLAGSSVMVYMKGDNTKTVMDFGMSKTTILSDKKKPEEPVVLLDIMGSTYQLKMDKQKKDDDKAPDIKYTDETKQIAGYTCHKAVVTSKDKDGVSTSSDVYYTEELPAYGGGKGQFKGLKGFPLEYSTKQQGVTVLMSATKVEKEAVTDDAFVIPEGYKLMTPEEMQEDIQKNMSGGGN